jgi:uncharacterized membrane protein/osmotically-inducible protein OsmY
MATELRQSDPQRGQGSLLLGAGFGMLFMYLMDPESGRRRRARLRDQYVHTASKVRKGMDVALRDAGNRAEGMIAVAHRRIHHHDEVADDWVLVQRVRSALGRVTSHPHAVEVEAHQGQVTLKGVALAAEADDIVAAAAKVPGVKAVDNQLTVYESPEHIPSLQGGVARRGMRMEMLQANWAPAWRLVAGVLGATLTGIGWSRGGIGGLALGAAGGALLVRAAANRELKSIFGLGATGDGVVVQKTIHINAPVEEVFRRWHVENFPEWMSHVREVRPLGGNRYHWVVDGPADIPVEWEAEVTRLVENQEIAWRSLPGSIVDNAGRVRFAPENGGTRVEVTVWYVPIGGLVAHAVARAFGSDPKSRMDDDLMRLKSTIETGHPPHDAAARRAAMHRLSSPLHH